MARLDLSKLGVITGMKSLDDTQDGERAKIPRFILCCCWEDEDGTPIFDQETTFELSCAEAMTALGFDAEAVESLPDAGQRRFWAEIEVGLDPDEAMSRAVSAPMLPN